MQTIITFDGNLFSIAANYLGSALQWINIAKANKLVDPMLLGKSQIVIPPFLSSLTDGIGPQ